MANFGGGGPHRHYPVDAPQMSNFRENGLVESVEKLVQQQVERLVGHMPLHSNKRGGLMGSDRLDPFDPDTPGSDPEQWILRFDELGDRFGWSDFEKMYLLKGKLRGRARDWYTRVDTKNPDLMWDDWKKELWRAFSPDQDFGADLEELVTRRKLANESLANYFDSKITLCERCGFDGPKAVSCIIRGLPQELRGDAYKLKCQTPEELFSKIIDMWSGDRRFSPPRDANLEMNRDFDDRGQVVYDRGDTDRFERQSGSKLLDEEEDSWQFNSSSDSASKKRKKRIRCFNCQEFANHFSKDCPQPCVLRCKHCGKPGHTKAECWSLSKKGRYP